MKRWFLLLLALLILAAAVVPYARTLDYQFVWDDAYLIGPALDVHGPSDLARLWKTPFDQFLKDEAMTRNYFRPAVLYSLALDRASSGENPRGFHRTNVLLYAAACLFLWLFAWELSGWPLAAALGTMVFALHPAHAESVAFISGRTDVQAALFLFAALWAAVRFGRTIQNPTWKLAPAAAILLPGLFSKEVALFGAPILLLALWVSDRKISGRDLARASGVVVVVVATYLITRFMVLGSNPIPGISPVEGATAQILTSVAVVARYVPLLLMPIHLSARHEIAAIQSPDVSFVAGVLILAALATGLWMTLRSRSPWSVPLALFVATLLPVCYVKLLSGALVAERFLFVPSAALTLGIALACAALLLPAGASGGRRSKPAARTNASRFGGIFMGAIFGVSVGFGAVLWPRVAIWRDEGTLYQSMLRDSPESPHVQAIVGGFQYKQRDLEGAAIHYRRAIELAPEHAGELLLNLVAAEDEMGQRDSAFVHVRQLTAIRPDYAPGLYALGNLHAHAGRPDSAAVAYQAALQRMPSLAQAENNLGAVLEQMGRTDEALIAYRRALDALPGYPDAINNLRRLSAQLGVPSEMDSLRTETSPPTGAAR